MSKAAVATQRLVEGLRIQDDAVQGRHGRVPIRRYTSDTEPSVTLLWVHGGGFSNGGLDQLESHAVAAALAHHAVEVIAVDYRRVPQWNPWRDLPEQAPPGARFPVPLDDVSDVFNALRVDRPRVILGGASAGACLGAGAALRLRDQGPTMPDGLVLAYGTFHAALPPVSEALRQRLRGHHGLLQFRPATVRRMNRNYAGSTEAMKDPYAFPGGHDLQGLPTTLMVDADRDALRASGEAFADELDSAGVTVAYNVVPGSTHGFFDRPHTRAFTWGIEALKEGLSTMLTRL